MRKGIVMKILVGLSGGFDSAYAAKRLLDEGHTVEGAALDMHAYTELEEARTTAEALGIPFHIVPCRSLFESAVIDYFCDEYLAARTPNPCIMCNEKVKFRALYDYAMSNGFDRIATGHYVRIAEKEGRLCIARAMDDTKDQSYMLYRVPPEILEKTVFPMGNIIKKEAKKIADLPLRAAVEREESQEICFVRDESYADFIERRCGVCPHGSFVTEQGELLGEHCGLIRYTVGQRKGLGVSAASRLFVQSIDPETNRIVLSDRAPQSKRFTVICPAFDRRARKALLSSTGIRVRVRYTAPPVPVRTWEENGALFCELESEARCSITPGQSAVFYDGDRVIYGGIIEKVL